MDFTSRFPSLVVWDSENDLPAAVFADGRFSTTDKRLAALLAECPDVDADTETSAPALKCAALKKDGDPCNAYANAGSLYCNAHKHIEAE